MKNLGKNLPHQMGRVNFTHPIFANLNGIEKNNAISLFRFENPNKQYSRATPHVLIADLNYKNVEIFEYSSSHF